MIIPPTGYVLQRCVVVLLSHCLLFCRHLFVGLSVLQKTAYFVNFAEHKFTKVAFQEILFVPYITNVVTF